MASKDSDHETFPPLQCSNAFLPWLIQTGSIESEMIRRIEHLLAHKHVSLNGVVRKKNNNLFKLAKCFTSGSHSSQGSSSDSGDGSDHNKPDCSVSKMELLALNALELTSAALTASQGRTFVQLSGHPGSFKVAAPNTVWKKLAADSTEYDVYAELSELDDPLSYITPKFYGLVKWNSNEFLELQDLLTKFQKSENMTTIMDIKLGTRTFLESEVNNTKPRRDLYDKLIKLDPNEPSETEKEQKSITKLRYMVFREAMSSSRNLGFRIEAVKFPSYMYSTEELKKLKERESVIQVLKVFSNGLSPVMKGVLLNKLRTILEHMETSDFFSFHEFIGSSLLIVYDARTGDVEAWLIDFAKTIKRKHRLNHRIPWINGNHEDGVLFGMDNLIDCCRAALFMERK